VRRKFSTYSGFPISTLSLRKSGRQPPFRIKLKCAGQVWVASAARVAVPLTAWSGSRLQPASLANLLVSLDTADAFIDALSALANGRKLSLFAMLRRTSRELALDRRKQALDQSATPVMPSWKCPAQFGKQLPDPFAPSRKDGPPAQALRYLC
jgi:hypothetical protein